MMEREADSGSERSGAAHTVAALIAPVVACLRDDEEAVSLLVEDLCRDPAVAGIVGAAPAIARVYLRLAPPPDGADTIVTGFPAGARERFSDRELVHLGVECLQVARVPAPVEPIARAVFVREAFAHGELTAVEGAIATCWWCALVSARLRAVDPIEEAAAICRYVALAS
jgi:hypothetical protein